MLGFYANLMKPLLKVNFGEIFRAGHVVDELVNTRQGVLVLEGDFVQCAVINTEAEVTILLARKEYTCTEGTSRGFNLTSFKIRVQLCAKFLELSGGHAIDEVRWGFDILL